MCVTVCVCVCLCVCVCGCAVWVMVCLYILYYECVLITSVRNDYMCAVFQITDSILSHCGNVSHALKTLMESVYDIIWLRCCIYFHVSTCICYHMACDGTLLWRHCTTSSSLPLSSLLECWCLLRTASREWFQPCL